ncbi:helix-turn-helix transcriptional regulator [Stenotrophomonas sp.]|uniref:helix-turn-helix domain-containing protein n=1 Tax=Stenotrophomonas sp. TaxID=69392 RepID=UPI0028A19A11|nr:helix-turn-helix transcriptional regulator [Stenotrophomonas sp.]
MEITWADRIKALEARGWSLTAIGDAIGKSTSAVSDIKQKRTKEPGGMAAVQLHHLYSTGALPPSQKTA